METVFDRGRKDNIGSTDNRESQSGCVLFLDLRGGGNRRGRGALDHRRILPHPAAQAVAVEDAVGRSDVVA